MPSPSTPFLVSLSQCGYELQGHQMVTRTKRMLQGEKLVLSALSRGTAAGSRIRPGCGPRRVQRLWNPPPTTRSK